MDPQRWRRLQDRFDALAEQPAQEREAALCRLESEDPSLASELRAMLAADDTGFLEDAAGSLKDLPADDPELAPGTQMGPYRILRTLGEGGMGMVYLAERDDEHFRRQVALKVIKRGMDTHRVIRRFRAERQILASLAHPNIGHLYDGGMTDDGVPFFAMEYVDGLPIDRYCEENGLDLRRRLDLMRDVCAAVQHAHQNLIVHRDLKPSNVLVDAEGTVKLLDFGIAKLLDDRAHPDDGMTMTGLRPLTPDYASPEQVRGETLTTAADIYSLGVLLHVLLTRERPHDLTTVPPHELAAAVESLPRPRPSAADVPWRSRLKGDLDTIVQVAMHPEPRRRYHSAEALSDDLRQHLRGHPIAARADSVNYRAAKFIRRNRLGLGLVAGLFAVTLAFALATGRQARLISRQAESLALERDRAEDVTGVLVDMFDVSDPIYGSVGRGDTLSVRDFLQLNEERLMTELADQPELKATVSHLMARLYGNLGLYDRAEGLIRQSLAIRREIFAPPHAAIASALDFLGTVVHRRGDYEGAEPLFREALAMRRELFSPPHLDIAESLNNLSWNLGEQDRNQEAVDLDREALAMRRAVKGDRDPDVAQSLNNIASTLYAMDRLDEAEPLWREALALRRELLGPDHPYVANTMNNLGRLLRDRGAHQEADTLIGGALEVWARTLGPDHPRLSAGWFNLALNAESLADLPRAVDAMARALELDRAALPDDHPFVAQDREELGRLLLADGRPAEALPHLRRALSAYAADDGDGEDAARLRDLVAAAEGAAP